MAVTQLRGSNQLMDATVTLAKMEANFLGGSDWNLSDGNNNATITGVKAGVNPYDVVNVQQFENALAGLDFQPDVDNIQSDATLDPGASPTEGVRYIVQDTGALHANFGAISGVGNNDIVEYRGSVFVVAYDVSAQGPGALVWDRASSTYQRWDGTGWAEFGGLAGITAGTGLVKSGNTINFVAADNSLTVNADSTQVNVGNTNGTSLQVSASGLELASTVTGNRTFNGGSFAVNGTTANFYGSTSTTIGLASSVTSLVGSAIDFVDSEVAGASVATPIPLAVTATGDYGNGNGTGAGDVIDQFRAEFTDDALINAIVELKAKLDNQVSKLSPFYNESLTVTHNNPDTSALANLGTHASDKVTSVRVYLNGARMNPGATNDYVLNALTGVISFTFNLKNNDAVLVDYDQQDA